MKLNLDDFKVDTQKSALNLDEFKLDTPTKKADNFKVEYSGKAPERIVPEEIPQQEERSFGADTAKFLFSNAKSYFDKITNSLSETKMFKEAGKRIEENKGTVGDYFTEELSSNLSEFGKSFSGRGTAGVIDTIVASPINFATRSIYGKSNPVGDFFADFAEEMRTGFETDKSKSVARQEFSFDKVKSPDFWITSVAENIPTTLAFMKLAQLPYNATVNATKSLMGASRFAGIASEVAGSVAGGVSMRSFESAGEAEETYKTMRKEGKSDEEARKGGAQVFIDNMKLAGLDAVQVAMALSPIKFRTGNIMSTILKEVASLGAGAISEGGEEVYQYGAQQQAQGKSNLSSFQQFLTDPQSRESGFIGAVMGLFFQAGGRISQVGEDKMRGHFMDKVAENLPEELKVQYDSAKTTDQKQTVLDKISEANPEAITSAVQAVEDEHQKAVSATNDVLDTIRNTPQESDVVEKLKSGATENEVILDLSRKIGTEEATTLVKDVATRNRDVISETQKALDGVNKQVKQAKAERDTLVKQTKQPTEKKKGNEVIKKVETDKPLMAHLDTSHIAQPVVATGHGVVAENLVFVAKNKTGGYSVFERSTGLSMGDTKYKNTARAIADVEAQLVEKMGSLEEVKKNIQNAVATKEKVNDLKSDGNTEKTTPKTQKERVKEAVKGKKKSIKEVAKETGIAEPNVRRILGVGAKDGTFERVAEGVYTITKDGEVSAVIIPADAREALPKLVKEGFKADMVFLDIPYDTPAVKGGNRGVKYELISVEDFGVLLDSVKEIVRETNSPLINMFSQAPSGIKKMEKYLELITEKGFIPVGRGELQKTFKDGSLVTSPNGKIAKPEGIMVYTLSGELNKKLGSMKFKLERPKGYQTEKPAEMIRSLIEMTTNKGDIVFDPFAGSGVVPDEAVRGGRKAVAIEKKEGQAKEIAKRVQKGVDATNKDKDNENNGKDDKTIQRPNTDTGGELSKPDDTGTGEPKPLGGVSESGTGEGQNATNGEDSDTKTKGKLPVDTGTTELGSVVKEYSTIEDITKNLATISENGEVSLNREATENEKKVLATFKSGGITKAGKGILDEYYTDQSIVEKIYSILNIPNGSNILEPSVATGNFIDENILDNSDYSGYEINETTAKIAKLLHPKASIFHKSFEQNFIDEKGNPIEASEDYNLIVGNPPYGSERGRYIGLGEEKNIKRYEEYFTKRSVDLLQSNGILAFVLPSGFLDKTNSKAKEAIVKNGGYVLRAFRLPNKAFKGTDIGTDIIFIKKGTVDEANKLSNLFMDSNYFVQNPNDILGKERLGKDQFGKDKMFIDGTLADALAKIGDFSIQVAEHVEVPTTKAERQTEEKKDKAHEERKKKLQKEVLKRSAPTKKGETTIANAKARNNYTDKELEMYDNVNSDMTVDEQYVSDETKSQISYSGGKWYLDFFYLSGDIYEKLEVLEREKSAMSKEDYESQKKKLDNALPERLTLDKIKIQARDSLLTESTDQFPDTPITTISKQFIESLDHGTNYGGLYRGDVLNFIDGKSVTGGSALQNDLIRRKREVVTQVLMDSFIANLPDPVKKEIEERWNRRANAINKEDYSKFPLKSVIGTKIMGNPFTIRESQLGLIGQIIVKGKALGALEVGVGKTPASLVALYELMVRGWVKKPILVVPASTLSQWQNTILSIIPNSTVNNLGNLSSTKDFSGIAEMLKEGTFTLLSHEAFQKIEFKGETYQKYASEFSSISQDLSSLTTRGKEAGKRREDKMAGKFEKGTDSTFNFEDMGTDFIIFDELHEANNGITNIKRPIGEKKVGTSIRTQYEFSEFDAIKTPQAPSAIALKTWLAFSYIQDKYNSRNVVGLSATPYTNSPVQIFFIASMFMRTELKKMGIDNVNAFIRRFINTKQERIQDRSGEIVEKKIVNGFKNKGVFSKMISHFQETQTGANDPLLVRPVRNQKIRNMKLSTEQARIFNTLQRGLRAEVSDEDMSFLIRNDLTSKDKEGNDHASNIKIQNAMRLLAVSEYFLHEKLHTVSVVKGGNVVFTPAHYKQIVESNPRIMAMLKSIKQSLSQEKSGHIVYLDIGVALYPAIKWYIENVEKMGKAEIIAGGMTPIQKDTIKDDFNSGKVDIILGTSAVRVGMNLQARTSDIHFLAYPYNFEDYMQVQGRGWRHGNKYANIRMNHYLQENSYDIIHFQILSAKQSRRDDFNESVSGDDTDPDAEISSEDIISKLISDPEVKASYTTQKEQEANIIEILNLSTESNRLKKKSEKLVRFSNEMKELGDSIKALQERIKNAKKANDESDVTFYNERLADKEEKLAKLTKERDEYIEKQIDILGKDYQKEIDKISVLEARVEVLKEQNRKIKDKKAELVTKYTEEMGEMTYHTDQDVKDIVAIVKKENETAFTLVKEKPEIKEETEVKVQEIKNGKGKVVKKKLTLVKKEKEPAKEKTPKPKSTVKDVAILKVLTDKNLTVKEKVSHLLDKKQEGKKYKDSGERVAGSKKENAVINAVIEHGDSAILRQLAEELGNETVLAQLDKKKLTEDMETPTAEGEKKKNTPAFIANYKVNVWNRVARTPDTVRQSGKYNRERLVDDTDVEEFITRYAESLRGFLSDLNTISTPEQAVIFYEKYTNNGLMTIKRTDTEDDQISINVLGLKFRSTLSLDNVSMGGKFSKDNYRSAYRNYKEAQTNLKGVASDGIIKSKTTYNNKDQYETVIHGSGYGSLHGYSRDTEAEAIKDLQTYLKAEKLTKEELLAKVKTEALATIAELNTDYAKFLPDMVSTKDKQMLTAEKAVTDLEERILQYTNSLEEAIKAEAKEEGHTYFSSVYYKKVIADGEKKLVEARSFLARLKGEETKIEHGNFQTIEEYDVKDSRFKKEFVKTDNLMKVYGFKSSQLGNYMDDESAREHIVQTMGAIEDMGKLLNIDFPKMINKMGLSIAYGARGGGGSAVAHFEPTHKIINITKRRGDGSFGHEFLHAMDYILGASRGKWSSAKRSYDRVTSDIPYYLTKELQDGVKVDTEETFTPADKIDESDRIVKRLIESRESGDSFETAMAMVKQYSDASSQKSNYQAIADVYRKEVKATIKATSKEYYTNSLAYGGGKDSSYWVRPQELWARAFQAYMEDKMETAGIKNNYITRSTKDIPVYPQGTEREAYNARFDQLFAFVAKEFPVLPQTTNEPRFKAITADPSIAEARKYATAEDFVQAQGTIVYHGTDQAFDTFSDKNLATNPNGGLASKIGHWFADDKEWVKNHGANVMQAIIKLENPKIYTGEQWGKLIKEKIDFSDLRQKLVSQGYDGVKIKESLTPSANAKLVFRSPEQSSVFSSEQIKTKAQLTDIWNKAHETPMYKSATTNAPLLTEGGMFLADLKARLNVNFNVHVIDQILAQGGDGKGIAWGVTHDNAIAIVKDAPRWTQEHEAVHITTANLDRIPLFQKHGITRKALLTAQASKMSVQATNENVRDIEEGLAEGFEQYMENKSDSKGIIRKFYTLLKNLVRQFAEAVKLTNGDIIQTYYDLMAEGEAVDNAMVELEERGILESFIENGDLTIPEIGARFKLKGEKNPKVANLKSRYNSTETKQTAKENEARKEKQSIEAFDFANASEKDVHAYMLKKTKLEKARAELVILHTEIASLKLVVEQTKVADVSRKLKLRNNAVERVVPIQKTKGTSAFQHRMQNLLQESEQGDVFYDRKVIAEQIAKAEAYYDANKKRTTNIALGKEQAPDGVTANAISLVVIQKAKEAGDYRTISKILPKLSLRATAQGQEISMLQDAFGVSDPVSYMNKLIAQRKMLAKKKYKPIFTALTEAKAVETIVKEKLDKARKKAPKLIDVMQLKAQQIDDFLNDITC